MGAPQAAMSPPSKGELKSWWNKFGRGKKEKASDQGAWLVDAGAPAIYTSFDDNRTVGLD